jgi:quercetin dioxygenase-like cupin family protein
MSDFTIKNLVDDVEDAAAHRNMQGLQAHFARQAIESEHLGVTLFRCGPGYRPPFGHRHGQQEEAYVVVSGSGRMRLEDDVRELRQWDVVRVAPHVARGFEAGPDGMELLAIGSDRPEGGDGEMLPDFWTD